MGTDAWAVERVSEKAGRRITHPSPHDTVSGAVWDGSITQKCSHEGWNGLLNKETRQPIYEKQPNKDKQPLNPLSP